MYSFLFVIGTEKDVVWKSMRAAVYSQQHYIVEDVPDCIEKTEIKNDKADVNIIKRNANKIFNRNYLVGRDEQPIVFAVPKGVFKHILVTKEEADSEGYNSRRISDKRLQEVKGKLNNSIATGIDNIFFMLTCTKEEFKDFVRKVQFITILR